MMAKASKAEAHYTDDAEGIDHCAICTMFRAPSACTAVESPISPQGWCRFFKRRPLLAKEAA